MKLALGLAVLLVAGTAHAQGIEDPSHAMEPFYRAFARVKAKQAGALVRILHYGDSITSNDAVTRHARERLQAAYGDGGGGFVPFALPSRSYRHYTVLRTMAGWTVRSVTVHHSVDSRYGVGGASFEGTAGAHTTFATMKKGTLGTKVSHYDVYYLQQPGGGTLALEVDGQPKGTIDTAGTEVKSGFFAFDVPDGAHQLTVTVASGRVRGFGVVMERPGPGITYDNLGLASNSARSLKTVRVDHFKQQHDRHAADLIIVHLGTNEADWYAPGKKSIADYQGIYGELLGILRAAAPRASCLVMGPTDAAFNGSGGPVDKPAIPGLIEAQRKAALAKGCAFWDAYAWMGGKGSVVKWFRDGNWEPDLTHPNASGAGKLADGLVDTLLAGFQASRK